MSNEQPFPYFCKPLEKCTVQTTYGTVHGRKCTIGRELNRLVSVKEFPQIVEEKQSKPHLHDQVSLSTCPNQTYGGVVRIRFETLELLKENTFHPICYIDETLSQNKRDVLLAVENEGATRLGLNWVRAKYALAPDLYGTECEYETPDPVRVTQRTVNGIEYWIAQAIGDYQLKGHERMNVAGGYNEAAETYLREINKVREGAEQLGVPFSVKSCFKYLKAGSGLDDKIIPLTPENLGALAQGKIPDKATWIHYDDRDYGRNC